ncbi:MAG TPA: hypothetical protein PKV80_05115 [Leptospiraceae bacterium]|nr:hypothetical protein [Leptospiraceae bacterium]
MEIRYFSVLAVFFLVFQSSAFISGERKSGTADPVLVPNLIESSLETESMQNILQGKRRKPMNPKKKTVSVRILQNQKYTYDLGMFGDEEGASIQKQASHFSISEIEREPEKAKYYYTPEKDFTGTDEVEIVIERGSDGASPSTDFTVIIIKFTISKK